MPNFFVLHFSLVLSYKTIGFQIDPKLSNAISRLHSLVNEIYIFKTIFYKNVALRNRKMIQSEINIDKNMIPEMKF